MDQALQAVYGAEKKEAMLPQVFKQLQALRQNRPANLKALDDTRPVDWVKDEVVYMLYPERFGISKNKPWGDFDAVSEHLPYFIFCLLCLPLWGMRVLTCRIIRMFAMT
jgi:hypothetical protein